MGNSLKKEVLIKLLGDFRILRGGVDIALPKSKKVRALFAYLIVTGRPVRRIQLCEMFWGNSDDPKAALRWALSTLKKVTDTIDPDILEVDRERVRVNGQMFETDLSKIRALTGTVVTNADDVMEIATKDEVLEGLELPNLLDYSAWLTRERESIIAIRVALITSALLKDPPPINKKIELAKLWLDLKPFSSNAAATLLQLLKQDNRVDELANWNSLIQRRFEDIDVPFDPAIEPEHEQEFVQSDAETLLLKQRMSFCKAKDGVTLAYASVGNGPPLIKAANWLSHLEHDWSAPIWSPIYRELAKDFTFIRYDERGNGLSDWEVNEISQKVFVEDLGAIIDQVGYDKFPLLGISQGAAVCIDYAISNPDRVTKLVLFGGYPKGWRVDATPDIEEIRNAMMVLTRTGWGQENPAYRQIFSQTFMPTATPEQLDWFNDFQRKTTSSENAVKFLEAFADLDVRKKLSRISVPTLVVHSKGDQRVDWTVSRDMALEIPDAEFVLLDSENHLLLDGEPAADEFISVVKKFLLGPDEASMNLDKTGQNTI